MRQAIAKHMVDSRRTAAHCTTIVEVDMSRVAARRAELKETMARRGVQLTYLAFVARATVEALAEHPMLNASVEGDEIVHHDDVNLGIAVALDDGLIVPVIPRAQRLSLEGLAAAIADVAERARSKRLDPDEVHGGTFTITNPGQFGAVLATPIINQPQVAILDLEAIVKRPVVIEGRGRGRDRDPADDLPADVVGPPGPRRRRGGAVPRRVKARLEGWEARVMAIAVTTATERRAATAALASDGRRRPAIPPVAFDHEELVVRRGARSGVYVHRRDPLDRARPGARRAADVALRGAPTTARATRCAWPAG